MPIEIPNYGRHNLAELFWELNFKKGVEIGVRGGDYSLALMEANPDLRLWGVDPYEPHEGYRDHVRKSSFEAFEKEAHDKLDKYANYTFIRDYSDKAVEQFEDNSLDFVYLDGDHSFYNVTQDIELWSKKVRVGGIISGDDYFKHQGNARIHVYQVVNAYTDAWKIKPWFVLGSKAIIEGEVRDYGRSYMWVRA
jgi:hypothetical protein